MNSSFSNTTNSVNCFTKNNKNQKKYQIEKDATAQGILQCGV